MTVRLNGEELAEACKMLVRNKYGLDTPSGPITVTVVGDTVVVDVEAAPREPKP